MAQPLIDVTRKDFGLCSVRCNFTAKLHISLVLVDLLKFSKKKESNRNEKNKAKNI